MIKVERSFPEPQSLKTESKKVYGKYDCDDVVTQLISDFHGKCYICEMDNLQDPQIEHLHPHQNRKYLDRVFDWNNLFLSCSHCNSVKNQLKYQDKIIDCCQKDPELLFDSIWKEGRVFISVLTQEDQEAIVTACLIEDVFNNSHTAMRDYKSSMRMKELTKEMNVVFNALEKYNKNKSSNLYKNTVIALIRTKSRFAAFKRSYIRQNMSLYHDLISY